MSRISIPATLEATPAAAQPMLAQVQKQLGSLPNMFRLVAQSPAALEGYLGLSAALGKSSLPMALRESLALALAEFNGCSYCLSAHAFVGEKLAKLSVEEIAANRKGSSVDSKTQAALRFALKIAETRGHLGDGDLSSLRLAGFDDAQVIEIVLLVALNILTNYLNEVAQTDIDFPRIQDVAA
ncbi:MAG: carboxymuconolactone decarboxylase family protein [Mangrovicoccus sp.]